MANFTIKPETFLSLTSRLTALCRGNVKDTLKLSVKGNQLFVFYKNDQDKSGLSVQYIDSYEVESQIAADIYLNIQELIKINIPSPKQVEYPKISDLTIDLDQDLDYIKVSYSIHWKPGTRPSTTDLKLMLSKPNSRSIETLDKYLDFEFNKSCIINSSDLKILLSMVNIYSADATSKAANNLLLKSDGTNLTALSTDSSTACKYSLDHKKSNLVFEAALSPMALKLVEIFVGKDEDVDCEFTIKHNKFYLKTKNHFMFFPLSANIEDLKLYLELFDETLPKLGSVQLKPLAESIKTLINNSKSRFFKLHIVGHENVLNIRTSNEDGQVINLPCKLNKEIDGLIDAYLLTNILKKLSKEDTIILSFEDEKNLWRLDLVNTNLAFLLQGMS